MSEPDRSKVEKLTKIKSDIRDSEFKEAIGRRIDIIKGNKKVNK